MEWSCLFFGLVYSCSAMQPDIKNYQIASELAQRGLRDELFSFVEQNNLDLNVPIDENEDTLMHKIASCEDVVFSELMLDQAIKEYKGNVYIENKKKEPALLVPFLLGNAYVSYKMIEYLDLEAFKKYEISQYIDYSYQGIQHFMNNAMQQRQNQNNLRTIIYGMLNEQIKEINDSADRAHTFNPNKNDQHSNVVHASTLPLKKHKPCVHFCSDFVTLASINQKYLFINPKRFQRLPSEEAKKALIAYELDLQDERYFEMLTILKDPETRKNINWFHVFKADYTATKKYPRGTRELLQWMLYSEDCNNTASENHPATIERLTKITAYAYR